MIKIIVLFILITHSYADFECSFQKETCEISKDEDLVKVIRGARGLDGSINNVGGDGSINVFGKEIISYDFAVTFAKCSLYKVEGKYKAKFPIKGTHRVWIPIFEQKQVNEFGVRSVNEFKRENMGSACCTKGKYSLFETVFYCSKSSISTIRHDFKTISQEENENERRAAQITEVIKETDSFSKCPDYLNSLSKLSDDELQLHTLVAVQQMISGTTTISGWNHERDNMVRYSMIRVLTRIATMTLTSENRKLVLDIIFNDDDTDDFKAVDTLSSKLSCQLFDFALGLESDYNREVLDNKLFIMDTIQQGLEIGALVISKGVSFGASFSPAGPALGVGVGAVLDSVGKMATSMTGLVINREKTIVKFRGTAISNIINGFAGSVRSKDGYPDEAVCKGLSRSMMGMMIKFVKMTYVSYNEILTLISSCSNPKDEIFSGMTSVLNIMKQQLMMKFDPVDLSITTIKDVALKLGEMTVDHSIKVVESIGKLVDSVKKESKEKEKKTKLDKEWKLLVSSAEKMIKK